MPLYDCEVLDPRIRRTRDLLQKALGTLMLAHRLDEISVADITDTATVNRATFYDHYTDKFALFDAMVAADFGKLLAKREVAFDGTCPSAVKAVILTVCEFLTHTHSSSAQCDRQSAFEPLFEAAVTASIHRVLLPGVQKAARQSKLTLPPEVLAAAASSAIFAATKAWFRIRDREPAEKFAQGLLPLITPMVSPGV